MPHPIRPVEKEKLEEKDFSVCPLCHGLSRVRVESDTEDDADAANAKGAGS